MAIDNSSVKWVVIGLVVLLLVPLVVMLGMMSIGALSSSGMMSHMGGMMGGSSAGMMGTAGMVLSIVWMALVAAALLSLIVLLARTPSHPLGPRKALCETQGLPSPGGGLST